VGYIHPIFSEFFETQNKMILGFKKQGVYSRRRMNHGGNANWLLRSYAFACRKYFYGCQKKYGKNQTCLCLSCLIVCKVL
jgi:hypothetical protein